MYSQDSKDKALGMLRLTGDVEKTARMSGVPGRTLRRWAAAAAKPRQRSRGAKFEPYGDEVRGKAMEMARGRRVLQGNRGGARHREPRCCTLLAERRRNEGGADGRPGKDT